MNFGPNFKSSYIDYSNTKFNKFEITEDIFETGKSKQYEYRCTYDIVIKYHNVDTDNKQFNRMVERETFKDKGTLVKTYNSRPDIMKKIILPEDDKEGTQDYAIKDYIDDNLKSDESKFLLVWKIFLVDIPKSIFEKAYEGSFTLSNESKLKSVEFNYKKPEVSAITLAYEDGRTFTVDLNNKITNKDVDAIIPDATLPQLYTKVDDWLEEDYEGTLGLLKEIFGFDFQTLKGANVR